jgi:hypothetical protein
MSVAEPNFNSDVMAEWFRQWQPHDTAKHLSRVVGAPPRTCRGWLSGQVPAPVYLARLFNFFGSRFAAAVMPGVVWLQEIDLEQRISATELELETLRREREAMR